MQIKQFEFNFFGVNTYVVWDPESRETAIIDPGMRNEVERRQLDTFILDHHLKVKYLINTHLHIDHVMANPYVEDKYGVKTSANIAEAPLGHGVGEQARLFHLRGEFPEDGIISHELKAGDTLMLGKETLKILEVPGHSPGSIAIYCPEDHWVITGDALFQGSIGRTDLMGGDYATLIRSIRDNLLPLPPETVVYPGHGPATTIGQERVYNPYL